ncbi:MAG: hypothetical protein EOM42_07500 [Negativicutes bacterium]|nr:hypothetical protein [Negativicutes bacterium]
MTGRFSKSKQRLEQINQYSGSRTRAVGAEKFDESHRRLTIYVEWPLYERLQEERLQGHSQTRTINEALKRFWSLKA